MSSFKFFAQTTAHRFLISNGLSFGLLLSLALVCNQTLAKEAELMASDPQVEARLVHIAEELRCLVCQNESLSSSRADLAEDLRSQVREQIVKGRTDQEIKDYLVERYGDFVLYRPAVKPMTWALWFGPFAVLLIGVGVLLSAINKRNKKIESLKRDSQSSAHWDTQALEDEQDALAGSAHHLNSDSNVHTNESSTHRA